MEDFVTYEQAKKLKELGFDWRCHYRYNVNKKVEPNIMYSNAEVDSDDLCFNVNGRNIGDISAPTLLQAQKWLFTNYDLWIQVMRDTIETTFFVYDINHADDIYKECGGAYENPTEAFYDAIDKALELISN